MGVDLRIVTAGFEVFIKERFKNDPALRFFILNHEKRHISEANVMREVRVCERMPRMKFDKRKLELLIAAGASIFCDLAKAAKQKQMMSAAELTRHERKASEHADTQAMVDEWAKEAQSTAVTKAVPGLRDGEREAHQGSKDRLGNDGVNGQGIQSSRRDTAGPGIDRTPV